MCCFSLKWDLRSRRSRNKYKKTKRAREFNPRLFYIHLTDVILFGSCQKIAFFLYYLIAYYCHYWVLADFIPEIFCNQWHDQLLDTLALLYFRMFPESHLPFLEPLSAAGIPYSCRLTGPHLVSWIYTLKHDHRSNKLHIAFPFHILCFYGRYGYVFPLPGLS